MDSRKRHTKYDQIAPTYDKRYERNLYGGVEQWLRRFIGNEPRLHILEVGCGTGHWLEALKKPGRSLTGLDASAGMLAKAKLRVEGVSLIRGEAGTLPLPSDSFDRLFCINALHHFPDKAMFLAEAHRVLRAGGRLLSVGLDPHQGLDQWHIYDYFEESLAIDRQRYLSSGGLRGLMAEAGFDECTTREVEHWTIRLPAREVIAQGRLEKESTSQLSVLTDLEYQRGMQRIHDDMKHAEKEGQTLMLTIDLRLYGTTGTAGN